MPFKSRSLQPQLAALGEIVGGMTRRSYWRRLCPLCSHVGDVRQASSTTCSHEQITSRYRDGYTLSLIHLNLTAVNSHHRRKPRTRRSPRNLPRQKRSQYHPRLAHPIETRNRSGKSQGPCVILESNKLMVERMCYFRAERYFRGG